MWIMDIFEALRQRDRALTIVESLLKELDQLRRENIRLRMKAMEVSA